MISSYSNIDLLVILLYLIITLVIGLYYSKNSDSNTKEYFLAGKSIGWVAIGLTIFSTNISSEHFIGLAGKEAADQVLADTEPKIYRNLRVDLKKAA